MQPILYLIIDFESKADLSRLAGLLTEWDFAAARAELERRLELCHDKYKRQEMVWLVGCIHFHLLIVLKSLKYHSLL